MKTSQFTVKDLELIVTLYQEGSLKRAADRLLCTPSALSHRVHELESRLGLVLVERHGSMRLTLDTSRLVPRAEHILGELGRLEQHVAQEMEVRRIGASSLILEGPAMGALVDVLESVSEAHWEIRTGHSADVENWVEQGAVDVGLVRLERLRPGLTYDVVAEDRLAAVAVSRFSYDGHWTDWPLVLFSLRMGHGQAVTQAFRDAGVLVPARRSVDSFALALALVERGGVSVLPWSMVAARVKSGELQELQIPDVLWPPRHSVIVTRQAPPLWVGALARAVRRSLSGTSGSDDAPGSR